MKKNLLLLILAISIQLNAQNKPIEKYKPFPFGTVKPTGWIQTQMEYDINGFLGNLDKLVPDLINDPIYSSGRLHKNSAAKDL